MNIFEAITNRLEDYYRAMHDGKEVRVGKVWFYNSNNEMLKSVVLDDNNFIQFSDHKKMKCITSCSDFHAQHILHTLCVSYTTAYIHLESTSDPKDFNQLSSVLKLMALDAYFTIVENLNEDNIYDLTAAMAIVEYNERIERLFKLE